MTTPHAAASEHAIDVRNLSLIFSTADGPVQAIAFTSDRRHIHYAGRFHEAEIADRLAVAVGHVGTMAEYLLNTVTHLEAAGIHDRRLWRMQALVAERLERLPALTSRS